MIIKSVNLVSDTGEVLRNFRTARDAVKELGLKESDDRSVHKVCSGKAKTVRGFRFSWGEELIKVKVRKDKNKVIELNKDSYSTPGSHRHGHFTKNCPQCNALQVYGRLDHYNSAVRGKWLCKTCGFKKANENKTHYYNGISVTWFNKFKLSAEARGIEFKITIEYISELYEKQERKCGLTGVDLVFNKKQARVSNASLDRIDSKKGYVEGNIMIVHKDINMMKQNYELDYFIDMCKKVAKRFT